MTTLERPDLLARLPPLKTLLRSRLFQPTLQLITLAVFTLAILTGLVGTPVGRRKSASPSCGSSGGRC